MKQLRWLRRDRVPIAVLMMLLSACERDVVQQVTESPRTSVFTQQGDPERDALTRLARAVAMALGESEFRKGVKISMQKALFKEHKLELTKFLKGSTLKDVANASGRTQESILADLNLVRPLEFYMPVEAQRDSWTGDQSVLVVTGIEEEDGVTGFDLRGNEVRLSNTQAPSVPTLAIVPQETEFDKPLDAKKSINVDDKNGNAIGTLASCRNVAGQCTRASAIQAMKPAGLVACGDECGGGGGSYATPGFYMTFSRIVDAKEPWWKGDPEVEVHVHAPVSAANSQYGADISCSGEHGFAERYFDQNNGFWNGSVLIIDQALNNQVSQFSDGYHIIFWEDDSTPCQLKFNVDVTMNSIFSVVSAVGAIALKAGGWGGWPLVAGAWLATAYQNKEWLLGNDDIIGVLVPATSYYDDGSNYTLMSGSTVNGRAKIVAK